MDRPHVLSPFSFIYKLDVFGTWMATLYRNEPETYRTRTDGGDTQQQLQQQNRQICNSFLHFQEKKPAAFMSVCGGGPSSCLRVRLPSSSVCQLLLISAGEVASVLSSDKALTQGLRNVNPGAVTIKTLPRGRGGADNAEHLSKRPNDLTCFFVFLVAHSLFLLLLLLLLLLQRSGISSS